MVQGCASLEDDRLQARQSDVDLEWVIGSPGQHGTHSGGEGSRARKPESSSQAETFLASFAKEEKAATYLRAVKDSRKGCPQPQRPPPRKVI